MPTISVIVPVYKVEKYIHRCVDSILGQTFTDFELILVDDGSPDNCPAICDEYAQKDSRIVVIHQKNGGLSAARNAGIDWAFSNSDSQWLTFIDSDDWVHVNFLRELLNCAVASKTEIARCRLAFDVSSAPCEVPEKIANLVENPEKAYISTTCDMSACGKLYRKSLFSNIRYPVGRLYEDAFTTYKIFFSVDQIATVDTKMYYCEYNLDSITRTKWNPSKLDEIYAYEEQLRFFEDKGFTDVHNRIALGYMHVIAKQNDEICECSIGLLKKKYYETYTSHKMRIALIKYRFATGASVKTTPWIYEVAYPRCMQIYWLLIALKKK